MPLRLLPGCPTDPQPPPSPNVCPPSPVQRSSPPMPGVGSAGSIQESQCPMCYHVPLSLCSKDPPLCPFLGPHCFSVGFPASLLSTPVHSPPSTWAVSETRTCSCCCPGSEPSSWRDLPDGAHTLTHRPAQLPSELLEIAPKRTRCFSPLGLAHAVCSVRSAPLIPSSAGRCPLVFKPLLRGLLFSHAPAPLLPFHGAQLLSCDGLGLLSHQTVSSTREGNSFIHSTVYCGCLLGTFLGPGDTT